MNRRTLFKLFCNATLFVTGSALVGSPAVAATHANETLIETYIDLPMSMFRSTVRMLTLKTDPYILDHQVGYSLMRALLQRATIAKKQLRVILSEDDIYDDTILVPRYVITLAHIVILRRVDGSEKVLKHRYNNYTQLTKRPIASSSMVVAGTSKYKTPLN